MVFGPTHTLLRGLAGFAFKSFWYSVEVHCDDGRRPEDVVPDEGTPMIVVANHWNSAADVAVLSIYFPHYRKLHYWAKSTLFAPGLPKKILLDAGNIPVDRKTKAKFHPLTSSFDSYTVPNLPVLKDGASWAALEYAKNIRDPMHRRTLSDGTFTDSEPQDVIICIAGIAYSDKTKYRSCAVMEFGTTISVEPYVDEFLIEPRSAVKKLTQRIHDELVKVTVNAPDWDSRHAATMARKILWPDDRKMPLRHLREIDQTLIDLFSSPDLSPSHLRLKRLLIVYRDALNSNSLSHLSLSSLPLPATLDPSVPHPFPTRARVLGSVLLSTLSCLLRLPFFLLPLLVHLPIYLFSRYASSGALEEDQAQNKVFVGLVFALGTYAAFFGVACALLWVSLPYGGAILVAAAGTIAFVAYHNRLVDDNYRKFQRLLALWRVLIGLWSPIAHSEASQLLHSVHPRLSSSYFDGHHTEATDGEESDPGFLSNSFSSANGTTPAGPRSGGRRSRVALPSPALFSEEDRLLGGFDFSHHHLEDEALADGDSLPGPRGPQRRRSRAREVRRLLSLRSVAVAALREALFGEEEDEFGDFERLPETLAESSRSGAARTGDESGRKAREVGERMREWGWVGGAGLGGPAKLT
ncbi:SPOSA6832_03485, partial [Sporobolomyces salmonicolor]